MKIKRLLPYFLTVILLAATIAFAGRAEKQAEPAADKAAADTSAQLSDMKGVWLTYMTLDVEDEADKKAAFIRKIEKITDDITSGGFNTVFVQVRPFCDAIYPSAYFPWSHIISGEQGLDPGFDPLKIICEKCRESGISVHAWVNPYRISTAGSPDKLSENNPYVKDSSIGFELNGCKYLKPSSKKAMELIANGAAELVENYDIDGIQFDDYFYPENCGDFDKEDYESFKASTGKDISLEEYRKNNVNTLIREVYKAVHRAKKSAVFGISPQGNWNNNAALFADVESWCRDEGYIDYICPQIYFSLDNPAMTFENALKDWLKAEKHKGLKLYAGLSAYKASTDADSGTWLDNNDILKTEIDILNDKGCDGFILFSYDSLKDPEKSEEIQNVIRYISSPEQ